MTIATRPTSAAPSTRAERYAAGAAHRSTVPLEAHAEVPRPDDRADPIELLVQQDATRLADLVPIRHGRMNATPFTFYRGTAAVMASDLSLVPKTDLSVQLCGDAHLSNFGVFNGPDRRLVFDLNDFDETHPGPFEWDLKRLAASVTIAGRNNDLSAEKIRKATRAVVAGYRRVIGEVAHRDPLAVHYFRIELDAVLEQVRTKQDRERLEQARRKALGRTSLRAFDKLTEVVDGRRRIVDDPPLVVHHDLSNEDEQIRTFFEEYVSTLQLHRRRLLGRYRLADIAMKVVGVGSVGTRCLIALLVSDDEEPLFLQFKEANASVLEPYLGASEFAEAGERVVQGQRLLQTTGDIFLGWARYDSELRPRPFDFYFRQLWDGKGSALIEEMGGRRLAAYADVCGSTLALAHGRSGDAATISGYVGDDGAFDAAIVEFSDAYADLTERDHAQHSAAIESGRLDAVRDV